MSRIRYTTLMVILVLLFVWGLAHLFVLRFEAGDVYPPYSSLRSDPVGLQALYESLNAVRAQSAERNFRPLDQLSLAPGRTLLICGLSAEAWILRGRGASKMMGRLSEAGGRLVIAFAATDRGRREEEPGDDGENVEAEKDTPQEESEKYTCDGEACWDGLDEIGVHVALVGPEARSATAFLEQDDSLPPLSIPWPGALFLQLEDDAWQIIYSLDDRPVIAERAWGRGSIVLLADSYLLSNEALRNDRFAGLLAWLIAPENQVIFDEFHNGLARQPGIAALARKYGLHGVVAVVLLVVILFVWRQTAVFRPGRGSSLDAGAQPALGPEASQGLVNLMQQHIQPKALIAVCLSAFRASSRAARLSDERLAKILSISTESNDPVERYRHICQLLQKGKAT